MYQKNKTIYIEIIREKKAKSKMQHKAIKSQKTLLVKGSKKELSMVLKKTQPLDFCKQKIKLHCSTVQV